jgi:hypothetical protein
VSVCIIFGERMPFSADITFNAIKSHKYRHNGNKRRINALLCSTRLSLCARSAAEPTREAGRQLNAPRNSYNHGANGGPIK